MKVNLIEVYDLDGTLVSKRFKKIKNVIKKHPDKAIRLNKHIWIARGKYTPIFIQPSLGDLLEKFYKGAYLKAMKSLTIAGISRSTYPMLNSKQTFKVSGKGAYFK